MDRMHQPGDPDAATPASPRSGRLPPPPTQTTTVERDVTTPPGSRGSRPPAGNPNPWSMTTSHGSSWPSTARSRGPAPLP
jgi:hypothetical protein